MRLLSAAIAIACLASLAPAQNPLQPARELQKLDRLVGSWKGSGTSRMTADAPLAKWTATQTIKKILNGHAFQDDLDVDIGPAMPPMRMRSYIGFDRERGRYLTIGASSMAPASSAEIIWTGDDEFVVIHSGFDPMSGKPTTSREVMRLGTDSYEFRIDTAAGTDPFFTAVQGTMRRVKPAAAGDAEVVEAAAAVDAPDEHLKQLAFMLGTWQAKGTMVPVPGAPKMPISGKQVSQWILGGTALETHVTGDPQPGGPAYEAFGLMTWNARNRCFDSMWVDNMGTIGTGEARRIGSGKIVTTMTPSILFGRPALQRSVLELAAGGKSYRIFDDQLVGAAHSERAFEATFTKIE